MIAGVVGAGRGGGRARAPPSRRRPGSRTRRARRTGTARTRWPAGRRSPSPRTIAVSLWTATTRAGRRPPAANGAKARSHPASQPRRIGAVARVIAQPDPLELAGALGVALGPAERPQPERDEHDAHRRCSGQTSWSSSVTGVPSIEPGAHAVEDVGRRRQARQHLHPLGQDLDRVVHAADEQQARLQHERHLRAALDVQQRQDRGDHADADEAERAEQHEHDGGRRVRAREVELSGRTARARRRSRPCGRGRRPSRTATEPSSCDQRRTGRHERVLEGALPALDGDRLGDPAEHDRQVVPEDRSHHQRQQQRRVCPGRHR